MVRIIGGKFRGRNLTSVKGMKVRPTSDRVKECLFDIIGSKVVGSYFLDLFAGIGSIGIEALSRGASKVLFVEKDRQMVRVVRKNLEMLNDNELEYQISQLSAQSFIRRYSGRKLQFDLIYIDPPYNYEKYEDLLRALSHGNLLEKDGLLVVEHSKKDSMRERFRYIEKVREKDISESRLSFYGKRKET